MKNKIVYLFLFALIIINSSFSIASTIHGSIYDMNLEKVKGVILEVDSTPKQRLISTDGNYSFSLQKGKYNITASYNDGSGVQRTEEQVTILSEGDFILDLFLFSDISEVEAIGNVSDISFQAPFKNNYLPYLVVILVLIVAILMLISRIIILRKTEEKKSGSITSDSKDTIHKILALIEKSHGRLTQKDIRKEIPLSEAKISLMITQLESEGKIKKIKKGRGNIIILNKN